MTQTRTMLGIFKNTKEAKGAIEELKKEDEHNSKDISVLMQDPDKARRLERDTNKEVTRGATRGLGAGALAGGAAGLAIGITVTAVPGGFIVAGPLAAALGLTGTAAATVTGAGVGAATGIVAGALTKLGMSADAAKSYQNKLDEGGVIVATPITAHMEGSVEAIMQKYNAQHMHIIGVGGGEETYATPWEKAEA